MVLYINHEVKERTKTLPIDRIRRKGLGHLVHTRNSRITKSFSAAGRRLAAKWQKIKRKAFQEMDHERTVLKT